MLGIKGKLALDNGAPWGFSGNDSVLNPKDVSEASGCAFNIPYSKSHDSQDGHPRAHSGAWQGRGASVVLRGVCISGIGS